MSQKYYWILLFIIYPIFSYTQGLETVRNQALLERIAETYIDKESEDLDLTIPLNELEKLHDSPLNINSATKKQLEQIFFLTSYQIENLIEYRNGVGQIYSIYELIAVESFNPSLIEDISCFLIAGEVDSPIKNTVKNEINIRSQYLIEKSDGFSEKKDSTKVYTGIRPKLYLQYNFDKNETLHFGITAENDSGEDFFKGSNKYGFDFYSGYLGWKSKKFIQQVIIGDYIARFGQGIILWTGFGKRKSAESTNIRFSGQGIKGYSSSNENTFLRGSAISLVKGNLNLIVFYSNKNSDANITEKDSTGKPLEASSLQTSGYHRTKNEIEDERSLNVETIGASIRLDGNNFSSGINCVYQKFNIPLIPAARIYNKFKFTGKENFNISSDFSYVTRKSNIFTEAAISKSGGIAFLVGLESNPVSEFAYSMLYRNYSSTFHSIGGNSISESNIINEEGFLMSFAWNPFPYTKISGYLDCYKTKWPEFNGVSPANATDISVNSEYSVSSRFKLSLRFREATSNKAVLLDSFSIKKDINIINNNLRLKIEWQPADFMSLNLRGELSSYNNESSVSSGWLCMADVSTSILENKLSLSIRASIFKTDDYNSRIYAFESDFPNNNYIPSFSDSGSRMYLNIKYKVMKNATLYLKVARTHLFDDEKTISSGLNKINENHKTDVKIQIKFRL